VLSGNSASLATTGAAVVNAGGSGFYRTAYGSNELANIATHLHDLDELERAVLFSDAWAATLVGRSQLSGLLTLTKGLGDLDEPATWNASREALLMVNRLVDDEGRRALALATEALYGPLFARLGWDPIPGETEQAGELRALAIQLLGTYGENGAIIEEALRRFDANEMVGDLAAPVLAIVVNQNRTGDLDVCEQRRKSAATPQDEQRYLFAQAGFPDLAIAENLFERCYTEIRNQDAPFVIGAMVANRVTGPTIWKKMRDRWDESIELFPTGMPERMAGGVNALIADPELAKEIRKFHTDHPVPTGQRQVEQMLDRMDLGVTFGKRVRPSLTQTLVDVASTKI
jgi:aminopeptidase N